MEFTVETTYDQKAMTAMARCLRKTIRKRRSKRSHILGAVVVVLAVILAFSDGEFHFRSIVTLLAAAAIVLTQIFEDWLNGYITLKRGLPGLIKSVVTFREEGYHSETAVGSSDFPYDTIQRLVRCGNYLVFIFSSSHGQVYDLRSLAGGTEAELIGFLSERTGKQVERV